MRVDGIIISVSRDTTDIKVFDWIRKMGIPLLFLDRVPEPVPPKFSAVVVDDKGGAFMAVEQAIRAGHKRIVCLGGDTHVNIGKDRIGGFVAAMEKHGLPVPPGSIVPGGYTAEDGFKGLKGMVEAKQLPDCIFAVTYPVALGVYEAAKLFSVRLPKDLDLICFGDSDVGHLLTPSLSCVNQPTRELGESAVALLMRMIQEGKGSSDEKIVVPTRLILRETCSVNAQHMVTDGEGAR
jgi:LacI family transcriptional regulator